MGMMFLRKEPPCVLSQLIEVNAGGVSFFYTVNAECIGDSAGG
jgi:hypothetical protein